MRILRTYILIDIKNLVERKIDDSNFKPIELKT